MKEIDKIDNELQKTKEDLAKKIERIMTEEQLGKLFCDNFIPATSKVFRKFSHNLNLDREWNYYTGTDMDVVEITADNTIISYELKGYRKFKGNPEPPGLYEGFDQALNYLNLPYVFNKSTETLFNGGVPDYVYLVHARQNAEFQDYEQRVFSVTPIGFIIATPNNEFHKVHEAKQNPIQSQEAKRHFLDNLNSLSKFLMR